MRALSLAAIATLTLTATPLALAAPPDDSPAPPHLEVQANASVDVAPDRATLNATLWEKTPVRTADDTGNRDDQSLQQARDQLEKRTSTLLNRLAQAGVNRDQLHAGSLSVRPEWLDDNAADSDGRQASRMRLSIERPITIDINDLSRIPGVVDALFAAHVDRLDGIRYDVADRDSVENRALTQALERAHDKAELMAKTLGTHIGRVLSIQESRTPMFKPMMARISSEQGGASQASYEPGTISVDAGVAVDWALDEHQ